MASMTTLNKIAVLLAAAALAGCMCAMPLSAEQPPAEDVWAKEASLEQLDGTWAVTVSETVPLKEQMKSIWDSATEAMVGADAKATMAMTPAITINAAAKTVSLSITQTVTFSGGNTAANWPVIRASAASAYSDSGVTPSIDDLARSVTATVSFGTTPVGGDIDGFLARFEINRAGTKLRQPAAAFHPELIYTRQ
jgi:hypothetical protein